MEPRVHGDPSAFLSWRGITLYEDVARPKLYLSADDVWRVKLSELGVEGSWYAELKVGLYLFHGRGMSAGAALDAAAENAIGVQEKIRRALRWI